MPKTQKWDQAGEPEQPGRTGIRSYGFAAICVTVALLLRFGMDSIWGDRLPFGFFFLAVVVVAQLAGTGPSLLAIFAGFLLGDWFFIAPRHSLAMAAQLDQINSAYYFVFSFVVVFLSRRVRHALQRERLARISLGKMTAIIESSDDAILGMSLDEKILSWNSGAERLYGYTKAEMTGRTTSVLLPLDRREEARALQERVAKGEHISHFETSRVRKDGGLVDVSLTVCPIHNDEGRIIGISAIARDITDRKKAEQEREGLVSALRQEVAERKEAERALQETQEMTMRQDRLAAVGRLAAGLAHEFNNILTIVQGHASLLLDNPGMDEDSVKSVTHITEGVERTAALVKQMLAFSRKQVMQQKVMHIKEATDQVTDMLGRLLGAHAALRFEVAPNLPPILADPNMLQQIIVNLTVNARDAMPKGGQLTIGARAVKFTDKDLAGKPDRRAGHFVQLSVTDTGSGIDADTITHLFEPFFTTKDVGKGTGLGLATVHGMVNQNAGWIEVSSVVGQGTTFNIYLPAAEPAPNGHYANKPPGLDRGAGETILVVEDDEVLRDLVRDILEAQGYRILSAATGREAMQVWEMNRDSIKLVLTDMSMPDGMSGKDLASRLKERNPRLPVIFSSGYSQETLVASDQADQDTAFLSKPYHPAELAKVVRAALETAAEGEASLAGPIT